MRGTEFGNRGGTPVPSVAGTQPSAHVYHSIDDLRSASRRGIPLPAPGHPVGLKLLAPDIHLRLRSQQKHLHTQATAPIIGVPHAGHSDPKRTWLTGSSCCSTDTDRRAGKAGKSSGAGK